MIDLNKTKAVTNEGSLEAYAADPYTSRGRLVVEKTSRTRTEFQRDRDRVIHSNAFRRLMHKTQVFVHNERDHFRTRLTHSIEVGQIARSLARALRVDEHLAEALALVHDFGHTPFGHCGETVLNNKLKAFGGFDHNAQSLRIVTELEQRYAGFDGLNLCWETLEGLVKHNGPLADRDGDGLDGPIPTAIADYNKVQDLHLWSWPSVEAQCAAIADDIAYDNHDLDDGLRAGLFTLDELQDVMISAEILQQVRNLYPNLETKRLYYEITRRQITAMVEDVIVESIGRLSQGQLRHADDIRALDYAVVAFSPEMEEREKELKAFLFEKMYRHEDVIRPVRVAQKVLSDLFDLYMEGGAELPSDEIWQLEGLDTKTRALRIADYLAGMTDRYAVSEYTRLFDRKPELG